MTFSLDVPAGPLAEAALSIARSSESAAVANHSLRSYYFAELLAAHEGCLDDAAYDRDLLFAATVMHDLGVGGLAKGEARFEVEGADLAAAVLREHGVAEPDTDRVWEAIALHTSPGIAERRGLPAYPDPGGRRHRLRPPLGNRLGLGAADPRCLSAPHDGPVAGRGDRGAGCPFPGRGTPLFDRRRTAPRAAGERDHHHGDCRRVVRLGVTRLVVPGRLITGRGGQPGAR